MSAIIIGSIRIQPESYETHAAFHGDLCTDNTYLKRNRGGFPTRVTKDGSTTTDDEPCDPSIETNLGLPANN
ncbi:hypothetical protein M4D50_01155 [Rothia sp. p3-SID1597]|nr:hypothetical protein [Rothia sp. p3-SID1597]